MIGIGVIGAGVIGRLRAETVRGHPETTLIGVADPDLGRAREAAGGALATPDWEALLEQPGLDAVIVSTPVHLHEETVCAAFAAGKHVLCEKPLSNTVAGCRRMLAASRTATRVLATGFNHRYYPSIAFIRQVLAEGRIGPLDHLRVFGGHDGLANFRADWQYKSPLSGGGAMMDVGIHMTDLARHFLGEVEDVYGVSTDRVWKVAGSEDNAMAILRGPNGVSASYHATWTEWKGYRFFVEAYGPLGMVRGYYAPMFNLLVTADGPGGRRKRTMKFYPEIILREKLRSWTDTARRSFEAELADFLRLVAGHGPVVLADGLAGVRAVEIARAVRLSAEWGRPVRPDEVPD